MRNYKNVLASTVILMGLCGVVTPVFAAQAIDLRHQPASILKAFFTPTESLKPVGENVDFKQSRHLRLQQMYKGYPVHGGDIIIHFPSHASELNLQTILAAKPNETSLNGTLYQGLEADLRDAPAYIFNQAQADKALQLAEQIYQEKSGEKNPVSSAETKLMVYVDKENKAHWAFRVSFDVNALHALPAKPIFILDAVTFQVYQSWNNLQTLSQELAGGLGGNEKVGPFSYDGVSGHYPSLNIMRNEKTKICFLQNAEVTVKDARHDNTVAQFSCPEKSAEHSALYWDAKFDAIAGAYSPSNDALFVGKIVKDMYKKWYGIPVLKQKDGKPMMLNMLVHENFENAYWDGEKMQFGDGGSEFYPLVSLGVGAHEISHGFTGQHSNLEYTEQSGGLDESFSDMAAAAAEYYATGRNTWLIGAEIMRANNKALRYMDEPTKDCGPGDVRGYNCSISHMKDYAEETEVHYSSGIFNKVFYLMSTSAGWDTKKAFDVMVHANRSYWTEIDSFAAAACGVLDATRDYGYSLDVVKKAFVTVGVDIKDC